MQLKCLSQGFKSNHVTKIQLLSQSLSHLLALFFCIGIILQQVLFTQWSPTIPALYPTSILIPPESFSFHFISHFPNTLQLKFQYLRLNGLSQNQSCYPGICNSIIAHSYKFRAGISFGPITQTEREEGLIGLVS